MIAEKNLRHSSAGFLTQIPALENGGGMAIQLSDGNRSTVNENRHHGLAGGYDRLNQLILLAEQIQIGAISQVGFAPCFTGGLLIIAQGQNHDIRFSGCGNGFCDQELVLLSVRQGDDVFVPGTADRYFAALTEKNRGSTAHAGTNALQDGCVLLWFAGINRPIADDPHWAR